MSAMIAKSYNKDVIMKVVRFLMVGLLFCQFTVHAESLAQAVQIAVDTNPSVQEAIKSKLATEQAVYRAYGAYFPSLDLEAGIGRERSKNQTTISQPGGDYETLTRRETGLSARQLVFDGFATPSEVARNKAQLEVTAEQILATSNNVALNVTKAYLDVIRNTKIVWLAKSNLLRHQKILKLVKKRSESGLSKRAELVQAEGRVALAETNYRTARSNLSQAKIDYVRVVGHKARGLHTPSVTPVVPASEHLALHDALIANPELKAANFDIDEAQAQNRAAKAAYYPRFDVELSARDDNDIDGVDSPNREYSAMIRARWNLFRGGSDIARDRETAFLKSQSKAIRDNTMRQVIESTSLSWESIDTNTRLYRYYRDYSRATRATADAYKKQFQLRKRSLLDLLDSEDEYFSAERAFVNSRYDLLYAKYRILNSIGTILPKLHVMPPPEALTNTAASKSTQHSTSPAIADAGNSIQAEANIQTNQTFVESREATTNGSRPAIDESKQTAASHASSSQTIEQQINEFINDASEPESNSVAPSEMLDPTDVAELETHPTVISDNQTINHENSQLPPEAPAV